MPELRWILLGAGVAFIIGLWWWETRRPRAIEADGEAEPGPGERTAPTMSDEVPEEPEPDTWPEPQVRTDHAPVVECHPRTVGVEQARDTDLDAVLAGVGHRQRLRGTPAARLTVSQARYIVGLGRRTHMPKSSMLHVRIDDQTKAQATAALEAMGLSVSDAVRILLKRIATDQAFPLELKVPNARARTAMLEGRAMAKSRRARPESTEPLTNDLEKAGEQ